jgi:hypothetical protein
LNNVIKADHGKLKQLLLPVRGFTTLKMAYATIKGFEVMRALRKGQASAFNVTRDICGRPASSSAPSASARPPWPRQRSFSTSGSSSKQLGRPHLQQARVGWVLTSVRPLLRPSCAAGTYGSSRTTSNSSSLPGKPPLRRDARAT